MDIINFCDVILSGEQQDVLGPPSDSNIRNHIAAISVTYGIASNGRYTLDDNTLLGRFRKGVALKSPVKQKLTYAWPLSRLLDFVSANMSSPSLSLDELRAKVIVLLRVDMCARADDLTHIYREHVRMMRDSAGAAVSTSIALYRPKEWRAGTPDWTQPITIRAPDSHFRSLDTVAALEEYLQRSAEVIRDGMPAMRVGEENLTPLFVSSNKQSRNGTKAYSSLSAQRISSICKHWMNQAGIDTTEDSPHSIRGVCSSHIFAITQDVNKVTSRGRWASQQTFTTYYKKYCTAGPPDQLLPPDMLDNLAHVLRCSTQLARTYGRQVPATRPAVPPKDTGAEVLNPPGPDQHLLDRQSMGAIEATISVQLRVGDTLVFPVGFWDDVPEVAVRGKVVRECRASWKLIADCDSSTLTISKAEASELIESGRAKIVS